jgi:hypothetical protein
MSGRSPVPSSQAKRSVGERGLGEPCVDADPQRARRELHEGPALVDRRAGQQRGDEPGQLGLAGRIEQLDKFGKGREILLLAVMRPDQRDGLAEIADIVVAQREQMRIDLGHHYIAQHRRLNVLEAQGAGEDGERIAAIRVRGRGEVLRHCLELAVARRGEREDLEQLRELLHSPSSSLSS